MTVTAEKRRPHNLVCSSCGRMVQIILKSDDPRPEHRCRVTGEPAPFDVVKVAE